MGNYRNTPVHVQALQLKQHIRIPPWQNVLPAREDGECETCHCWFEGKAGDWLVQFEDGHQEIMSAGEFAAAFVPDPGRAFDPGELSRKLEQWKREPLKPIEPVPPGFPPGFPPGYGPMGPVWMCMAAPLDGNYLAR